MTSAFDRYVAPARRRPQIWRLLLGCFLILLCWTGIALAGATLIRAITGDWENAQVLVARARTPTGVILLLSSFIGMALGCVVAVRILHARGLGTLIGPRKQALRDFLLMVALVATIYTAGGLLLAGTEEPQRNIDFTLWLSFLPLALAAILLQTGAEELVFRGYLQQQLAARFRSPWIWMLGPSLIFGFLHFDPITMGGNSWLIVAATTLFGLVAADLTVRTGTLGAAWGLHMANNAFALLITAAAGPLDGMALWTYPFPQNEVSAMRPLILLDMAGLILLWALARLILSRRLHSGSAGLN